MRSNQRRPASEHFEHYWSDGCELAFWLSSFGRRPTDGRMVGIAAWTRRVDGFPVDFGKRSAGREPLDQVGMGNSAGVPKLRDDAAAKGMHRVGDPTPSAHLFRTP